MKLLRVAAATLNQTPLDWDGNLRRITEVLRRARAEQIGLLCLPELCITGYGCEDAFLAPDVPRRALQALEALLPETKGLVVCFGLPLNLNKATYNVCCLVADGEPLGFVAKQALAGDGIHYEPRWFKAWPRGERTTVRLLGRELPLGDLHFELDGVRIGFEICEDAWTTERPGAQLALEAVDVILNPSASHFAFGKHAARRRLVLEGARAFGVSYIYANLLGNEAGRVIYDGDALIASGGDLLASAPRFSFQEWTLTSAVIDIETTRTRHGWSSSYLPHVQSAPGARVSRDHHWPATPPELSELQVASWEDSEHVSFEEFARAIALGLFDYLRKSRSKGFVVSLSGGADSAAVSCLVALMVEFGLRELGAEAFSRQLGVCAQDSVAQDGRAWVRQLLTTAYQATRNSSELTRSAARTIAAGLGTQHLELDVDALVLAYESLASEALGRPLDWSTDDLSRQNIQARVRAPGVWLLANLKGALLLATSNRSEAAVGYATMDGDTAGGLSPIAGIDKAFIRRWLRWLESSGPAGFGPIAALECINAQVPTAELRPPGAGQTDEAELMPYELLDAIERAAIRDKRSPCDIYAWMRVRFPSIEPNQLLIWVERFFRLWSRNQWKRERYAPSFHVDDANLDPKTWCRFPILSGGYERELAELRAQVSASLG